jgi:hypothetical protein
MLSMIGHPSGAEPLMVDVRQYGSGSEGTMDRHARLSQYSIVTLHFTPHKLRTDRTFVVATLKKAYKSGTARPRLNITILPAAS